jgi:ATP-binding cassette, subfamily B, bacterial
MLDLCRYSDRPIAFVARYVRRHPFAHAAIVTAVLAAVGCSVSTQYGVKFLVDTLSQGPNGARAWLAFTVLVSLMAADQLLWRIASWIGSYTFVAVTGDLRSDLFRHVTGHPLRYFSERLPGMLTSRITATSNAVFTVENMFVWNVLPPCVATAGAIAFLFAVSAPMAAGLACVAGTMVVALFRLAAAGRPLHHGFAERAALVDGEMADIIGNMPIVRAFGGIRREHRRFDETVGQEMTARRRSLQYLEKLRLLHAGITMILMVALLAWAIALWQRGAASTGDVVLVCTLGFGILHATRDLAVALVDVTQHMARLSEAVATLLIPHELRDHAEATALTRRRGHVEFEDVSFVYPGGRKVFERFRLRVAAGERVGLVGESGSGKSTLLSLLQRFHDPQDGRILIDGQDVARITQESLPEAIALVPQDISLLHRSILENIRYGRPEASDEEVLVAAAASRCLDFIDELPQGMATVVGDRGVRLSGGQRQRIAIARALLKDAPILLLDEATSALDGESEETIIRDALDRLMRGRTVIAVAHRLSTLRGFDRIVVLRAGQVVQDGPPGDLMAMDGPYRRLIQREMTRLTAQAA